MTTTAAIATRTFAIDKTHSEAAFQVRHLLTKVRGRFTDFSGTIQFDPDRPEAGSVSVTIDAASIDTNTADRDTHLRSEDFFFVTPHPRITFVSSKVTGRGGGRLQMFRSFRPQPDYFRATLTRLLLSSPTVPLRGRRQRHRR